MGRVVVGVDGSEVAREAFAFALDEARMRGAALEVVHVQDVLAIPRGNLTHSVLGEFASAEAYEMAVTREREDLEQLEDRARRHGEQLLTRIIESADVGEVELEQTVLFDRRPARRLVELVNADVDVDLLVVGSRGRGELTGRLLGSVSQACVAHARVPVTVVHPRRR